jgi:hypothetical protein
MRQANIMGGRKRQLHPMTCSQIQSCKCAHTRKIITVFHELKNKLQLWIFSNVCQASLSWQSFCYFIGDKRKEVHVRTSGWKVMYDAPALAKS